MLACVLTAALAIVGCASSGSDPADDAAGSDAGPVTVDHRFGSTTVDGLPERIVSLDLQWTDVLLSLGVTPVAYGEIEAQGTDFPWHGAELDGAARITGTSLPFEKIAGFEPDLIVGTFTIQNETDYAHLSDIAPTIPNLTDKGVDAWQDLVGVAGRVLDEPAAARDVVDGVGEQVAAVADDLPGLEGKTFVMSQYIPGDSIVATADPDDGSVELFDRLGMHIPEAIVAVPDKQGGRAVVSLERLDLLEADLLVIYTNGLDPDEIPGFADLPAVRSGAVAVVGLEDVSALNTPTPLSIPYALGELRPALDAAAGG